MADEIPELEVHCSVDGDGATFARPDGTHRLWLSGCVGWAALCGRERDAVCALVWPASRFEVRDLRVVDPVSGAVVGTTPCCPRKGSMPGIFQIHGMDPSRVL